MRLCCYAHTGIVKNCDNEAGWPGLLICDAYCLGAFRSDAGRCSLAPIPMTSTLAILLAALLLPIVVLLWLTESQPQRIARLHSYGWSQRRIASHMGVSRYQVRLALA
jgi:hypothetical protein